MRPFVRFLLLLFPLIARGQTLTVDNDVQTYASLSNTVVTMTGRSGLHITGTGDPISGSTFNLNSPDAWLYLDNILPSTVSSAFLSRVRVNGAAAVNDTNVRLTQFGLGAVVIPHSPAYTPLEVFDGKYF